MKKLRNYVAASIGLALFVTVIALSIPQTGHGSLAPPERDVRVINNNNEAVPVDVQGVVKSKQQGDWNVGITGTPTVEIGNGGGNPVLTRDVDRPTAQPFQAEIDLTLPDGFGGENAFIPVPPGKVLVIEHISAYGNVPPDQVIGTFSVGTRILPDNVRRFHFLKAEKQEFSGANSYTVSQQVRLYADVASVAVRATRLTPTGSVTFTYTISGYLVDK